MTTAAPVRSVSAPLAVAILLIPGIFAWFTLRKGYSAQARAISFGWLVLAFIIVIATGGNHAPAREQSVSIPNTEIAPVAEPAIQSAQNSAQSLPTQSGLGPAGVPVAAAPASGTSVSAQDLATAYEGNEVAAQARYGDQTLLVTGVVEKVGLDLMDNPQINLVGDGSFRTVTVQLEKSASAAAATINKGQSITVRCRKVTEVMSMPVLDDCSL